jgi:gliding motility-associated-like protein
LDIEQQNCRTMTQGIQHKLKWIVGSTIALICILTSSSLNAQTFVVWNDGGVGASGSGLTTITGTYPGGTVTATNTGAGNIFTLGQEFAVMNLNGANASEMFGTFGSTTNPPSRSLTFTFSTPVQIASFSMNDIDQGGSWHDGCTFAGVTFSSVTTAGGVVANMTGITTVPFSTGNLVEWATWFNSTATISSFTLNYATTGGKTHAYLGYSMEVTTSVVPTIGILGNTTVCAGDSVLLTSFGDPVHAWADSLVPATIISTDSAIYVSPLVTTTYAVYGTADTAYHTVTVLDLVPPFSLGSDTTICQGQSVLLDATSPFALDYLWQDASTNPTFLATQAGIYWAEVSNTCNTEVDSITITVTDLVQPFNLGNDTTICAGQSVLLDATALNATAYLWQDASTNPTLLANQSGVYWAEASNSCNMETDFITITVEDFVQPFNLGNDTTICSGQSVLLDGTTPNAASYLWQDASVNPTFLATQTGNYWVDASNFCGLEVDSIYITVIDLVQPFSLGNDQTICAGTNILLDGTATNATNYLWQDASTNATLLVDQAGIYWVQASNQCNMEIDSVIIDVINLVAPFDLGNDTTICTGETVLLDATTMNATNYLWQDASTNATFLVTQSGTYSVEASNQCGMEVGSITVTVIPLTVDLGLDKIICPGDNVVLDAGALPSGYLWNNASTNQTITVNSSGTYWVDVTLASCIASDTIVILVQELVPLFDAPIRTGCEPLNLPLGFNDQSTVNTGTIVAWNWSFGNGEFSTDQIPSVFYENDGEYDVSLTVTSNIGCEETITYTDYITVHPTAVASFGYGPNAGLALEPTQFMNTSTNSTEWQWYFGDGNSSTLENPSHLYSEADAYTITLIATNEFGCEDMVEHTLVVTSPPIVYVPNSFTPDYDEHNNAWRPVISEIDIYDFTVRIFNRWGEIIWESHDVEQGWDGIYGGQEVQSGIYAWDIEFGDASTDKRYTYHGHVNVLR